MNHNFQIVNADTDSISFSKSDGTSFSPEERKLLVTEINSISPEFMKWADDGYYKKVIVLKAKNYILQNEVGKITYKGSSLKDQKTETAIKEFKYEIIDSILNDKRNYQEIYLKYIKEILYLKDIKRWSSKKTLSQTTYSSTRTNETKVIDAIKGTEYKEGDRIWVYFDNDDNLKLIENYNNDHNIDKLVKKLYTSTKVFAKIVPIDIFKNYSLKKNQILLQDLK